MKKGKKLSILLALLAALAIAPHTYAESLEETGYIVLLPESMEGLKYDNDRKSESYSEEDYTVLFYNEGDLVKINAGASKGFVIKKAEDMSVMDDYKVSPNGLITFTMPASDLYFEEDIFSEQETDTADTAGDSQRVSDDMDIVKGPEKTIEINGKEVRVTPEKATKRVNTHSLNVRELPNADSKALAILGEGKEVEVTGIAGENDDWYRISFELNGNNMEGFIRSKYVD